MIPGTHPAWHAEAACLDEDPDLFFPETGQAEKVRRAKRVCARCPVAEPCLREALYRSCADDVGVWGGTSARDRVVLRRKLGIVVDGERTDQESAA